MNIEVVLKKRYGKIYYHPNCEKSSIFCGIYKNKTLSEHHLEKIIQLGFGINIVDEQGNRFSFKDLNGITFFQKEH